MSNTQAVIPFDAHLNTANTIENAVNCAKQCGVAGITKDGSIVTTKMCIVYQLKRKQLLLSFKAEWRGDSYHIITEYHGQD